MIELLLLIPGLLVAAATLVSLYFVIYFAVRNAVRDLDKGKPSGEAH